jgi:hypothetical protein
MSAAAIEMLERAAEALGLLADDRVAFVGGATIALWATDRAAAEFRPTDDVDVIVGVTTRIAYHSFEGRLRAIGFVNDESSGVICRFRHPAHHLILDAMPTDASIPRLRESLAGQSVSACGPRSAPVRAHDPRGHPTVPGRHQAAGFSLPRQRRSLSQP